MTWLSAIPVAALATVWVLVPGLPVTYSLGLRGVTAWGVAPLASIGSAATAAIVGAQMGIPWSPIVAVAPAILMAVVVFAVRLAVHRLRPAGRAVRTDGWRSGVGAAIGITAAVIIGSLTARQAMGRPDVISQTYDAVFHYNAVAKILAERDASSLVVGTLTDPSATRAFYPAAWHDMVSLVVLSTGASISLASNMMAIVVATVVWPLACLTLVRQVIGRSIAASTMTPLVSLGFIAFPWSLLTFGVLWPNLMGLALVPAALAAVITICRLAPDGAMTVCQAIAICAIAVVTLGLAHPNTLFSLAALSVMPVLWWLVGWVRARLRSGARLLPLSVVIAVAGGSAAAAAFLATSPLFDALRAFFWPAFETPAQAAGEVLLNSTNNKDAAWAISAVIIVGVVAAARMRNARWLIPTHLISGALFILAAGIQTPLTAIVTGFWYNDSYRLAAMVPITGVPLAVIGLLRLGAEMASRWSDVRSQPAAPQYKPVLARPGVFGLLAALLLVVASGGMYMRDHSSFIATTYTQPPDDARLLDPAERAFFDRIEPLIPADAVVAQNPWSGSALLWALTGRRVLFPALTGAWSPEQRYLADHLRDATKDTHACALARQLGVDYLLVGDGDFWPTDARKKEYPGLARPADGPGFEVVAADGSGNQLFRLTACEARPLA